MEQRLQPQLNAPLRWLDHLLHREMLRLRARYELSTDELRGLYISDEQVDALVADRNVVGDADLSVARVQAEANRLQAAAWEALQNHVGWRLVVRTLSLDRNQQRMLLLTWAPHLNAAYETLYAYLNNDVSKRYVTIDLAMRLFREWNADALRNMLSRPDGLFRTATPNADAPQRHAGSLLLRCLYLNPAIAKFLNTLAPWTETLAPFVNPHDGTGDLLSIEPVRRDITALARLIRHNSAPPVIVVTGAVGSGRISAACALAQQSVMHLLDFNVRRFLRSKPDLDRHVQDLALSASVSRSLVYLRDFPGDAGSSDMDAALYIVDKLAQHEVRLVIPAAAEFSWSSQLTRVDAFELALSKPDPERRHRIWQGALGGLSVTANDALDMVADQFELTPGQIQRAGRWVAHKHYLDGSVDRVPPADILQQAARLQSLGSLDSLAHQINTDFRLDHLVLPGATLERIKEIIAATRHRQLVFKRWGLQERIGGSTGLVALFAGTSGTGKTMTAGIIAKEIGLDLYRINLASIVSKYIGETEKNLEKIFDAARHANCVLFFDEAEAMFGKRSEVKDAHDRYANIETAYLLQKIECHDGIVILATNIAKNIDNAFARRVHYTVDFPRPDTELRRRLWQRMFPEQAPLDEDIDFGFLARQFEMTGGEIRNVARDAAMLAAGGEQVISMACIVQALARHLLKKGRPPTARDFKQYASLLEPGDATRSRVRDAGRAASGSDIRSH